MAIQKTEGLLLKAQDFRETSLILYFFTKDFGKVSGILKGVRGLRSRTEYIPQAFSLNQIVFYEKKKSELHIITQCEPVQVFLDILKSLPRTLNAYYIVEVVDSVSVAQAKNEEIFEALYNGLRYLDRGYQIEQIVRSFEVKLLIALGLWPGSQEVFKHKKLTKGGLATLECFERLPWDSLTKIRLTKKVAEELKVLLRRMIDSNLERQLKTARLLEEPVQPRRLPTGNLRG